MTRASLWVAAALLSTSACDMVRLDPGSVSAAARSCEPAWVVDEVAYDTGGMTGQAIAATGDGYLLGGTPHSADVTAVDLQGLRRWSTSLGASGLTSVRDILLQADGGTVVTIQDVDSSHESGRRLRVARLSSDGELQWAVEAGAAHHNAWMDADALLHPQGGTVISWHSSQAENLAPELHLARLDDQGALQWSVGHPLAEGSPVATGWARGAVALLGDGSILQLTSDVGALRLVRTAADGAPISDVLVAGVQAWPMGLLALPDGVTLVLANDSQRAWVLQVEPDGQVVAAHSYVGGGDSRGDVLSWDPVHDVLLLVGTARDLELGWERRWTLVLDRQGEALLNSIQIDANTSTSALDVAVQPAGGFVVTRHGSALYYERVVPCGAGAR